MQNLRKKNKLLRIYSPRTILVATLVAVAALVLFGQNAAKSGNPIDEVLRAAVDEKKVPGIVAMVSVADKVTYQGAVGMQDSTKNIPMTLDSIFRIASMTKPITSVALS